MKTLAVRDLHKPGTERRKLRWAVLDKAEPGRVWLNDVGAWARVVHPGSFALARLEWKDGDGVEVD